MPTKESLEQIETGELIQSVDDARAAEDDFKLSAILRSLVDTRLANLRATDSATLTEEGDRATASANVRAALDRLKDLLRDGYNFVRGIGSYAITDAERLGLYTNYGWQQGEIGELTDARTEALANQAVTVTPSIGNPAHQYPAALLTLIMDDLAILNANQPVATGGDRQAATAARDEALRLMRLATARVRFAYCGASDDVDQTPELAKIGFQPRRDRGAAGQDVPGPAGEVSFDDEHLTLSVAELPDGATTLRAYRMAAGDAVELAGESETNVVSVVETGELEPGESYEFWLVGHNAAGDGPESEHVQHTAPAAV